MTLDDVLELDTFVAEASTGGWVKYHWPDYRGKRCTLRWNREELRFAEEKTPKPLACVNRLLKEEGMLK